MGLFRRPARPQPAAAPGPAQSHSELERCARAALAHGNRVQVEREPHKRKRVVASLFGAIDTPARAEDLDETQALAASVMFLERHVPASTAEPGSVAGSNQEFAAALQARNVMRAGDGETAGWLAQSPAFD